MSFTEAIRDGFAHYVDFSGRAPRSAYWWWTLFAIAGEIVTALLDDQLGTSYVTGQGTFVARSKISLC